MLQSACWSIFIHEQTQHIPIHFALKPVITWGGNAIIISWQELWDRCIWENIKTWLNIMDIGREGWYPADCGLNWYTSSNAFSDNGKPRKARKGVIEGWCLNWGFQADILVGDLECGAHHSVTRRWEREGWGRGGFSDWIRAVHQEEN